MKTIYWIDINRFDTKIDKSTWLEISEYLIKHEYSVVLLTGYKNFKYQPHNFQLYIKYFKVFNLPLLFKVSLNIIIFLWLLKNVKKDDIILFSPLSLFCCVILKMIKKPYLHLDFRTIPVEIHSKIDRVDYFLNWFLQLKLFQSIPDSYSFITSLLKKNVEIEFNLRFSNYVIWQSGVNFKRFDPVRNFSTSDNKKFYITYIGVITKNRGLNTVIKSLKELDKCFKNRIIFHIIGSGSDLENLKSLTVSLGLQHMVLFEGYVPYELIPEKIKTSDCFISPLPNRPEWEISSPIKIFEYLASAKPIILTPISAHKVINNDYKFIVWTNGFTSTNFKHAIEYVYKNRINLSQSAKSMSTNFKMRYDWNSQAHQLFQFLKKNYG